MRVRPCSSKNLSSNLHERLTMIQTGKHLEKVSAAINALPLSKELIPGRTGTIGSVAKQIAENLSSQLAYYRSSKDPFPRLEDVTEESLRAISALFAFHSFTDTKKRTATVFGMEMETPKDIFRGRLVASYSAEARKHNVYLLVGDGNEGHAHVLNEGALFDEYLPLRSYAQDTNFFGNKIDVRHWSQTITLNMHQGSLHYSITEREVRMIMEHLGQVYQSKMPADIDDNLPQEIVDLEAELAARLAPEFASHGLRVVVLYHHKKTSGNFDTVYRICVGDDVGPTQVCSVSLANNIKRMVSNARKRIKPAPSTPAHSLASEMHPLLASYLTTTFGNLASIIKRAQSSDEIVKLNHTTYIRPNLTGRFKLADGVNWEYDKLVITANLPATVRNSILASEGELLAKYVDMTAVPGMETAVITGAFLRKKSISLKLDVAPVPVAILKAT